MLLNQRTPTVPGIQARAIFSEPLQSHVSNFYVLVRRYLKIFRAWPFRRDVHGRLPKRILVRIPLFCARIPFFFFVLLVSGFSKPKQPLFRAFQHHSPPLNFPLPLLLFLVVNNVVVYHNGFHIFLQLSLLTLFVPGEFGSLVGFRQLLSIDVSPGKHRRLVVLFFSLLVLILLQTLLQTLTRSAPIEHVHERVVHLLRLLLLSLLLLDFIVVFSFHLSNLLLRH